MVNRYRAGDANWCLQTTVNRLTVKLDGKANQDWLLSIFIKVEPKLRKNPQREQELLDLNTFLTVRESYVWKTYNANLTNHRIVTYEIFGISVSDIRLNYLIPLYVHAE